jgi:universal stress protein E
MSWLKILLSVPDPQTVEPHVLAKAARFARALDAELELFHSVFDPNTVRAGRLRRVVQADVAARVKDARRHLERAADSLRDQGIRAHTSVRWDYPAYAALARQVFRHTPDLLIAESTRRARAAPVTLTYADYRVLQTCPCPVLMIKTARPYRGSAIIAALDPPDAPGESPTLDEAILTAASVVSSALKAVLHACHAVPAVLVPVAGTARVVAAEPERQTAHLEAARRKVHAITEDYALPDQRVHVTQGIAECSVVSFAKEARADIVVIGAVSRSPSKDILIGRTAERLLNALDCDVLVMKPPGYRSPVARQSIQSVPISAAQPRAAAR